MFGPDKVQVSNYPPGLTPVVRWLSATQVSIQLTNAASPQASVTNVTVQFLDGAFNAVRATNIVNSSQGGLSVIFPGALTYSGATFTEGAANDGSVAGALMATLSGPTFTNVSPFVQNSQFTVSGMPQGLTCTVTRSGGSAVSVSLTGKALSHTSGNSTSFTLTFTDAAFVGLAASGVTSSATNLAIVFHDQPSVAWGGTNFTEAAANDGSIATVNTVTLSGDAFKTVGPFTNGNQFTTTGVPTGLTCVVTCQDATHVQVALTGNALAHAAANSTSFTVQFNDSAFSTVAAANITGVLNSGLQIVFSNQPTLAWDNTIFTEAPANDGSIGTINTVTLSAIGGATFKSGAFAAGTQFTTSGVPAGLTCTLTGQDATHVQVALAGKAVAHAGGTASFNLQFLDGAFNTVAASNITGTAASLSIQFHNQPSLSWDSTTFTEAAANDGSIATTNTVTLTDPNGVAGFAAGIPFTATGVPAGLACAVTRLSSSQAQVVLTGKAAAHTSASNTSFSLQFLDGAFTTVAATNIAGIAASLGIVFHDQPSLAWDNTTFMEAAANDGSIATTNTVTLSNGAAFKNVAFAPGVQYTTSGVPAGLTCVVTQFDAATVKVALSGHALAHGASDSTSFALQFLDGAFDTVAASNITGSAASLAVQFAGPAQLTYNGGDTFYEASLGTINNSSPITIGLAGDTFTGTNGSDFVLASKVSVAHLPDGLTAAITKDSDTQLSVRLTGAAYYNDAANDVTNLTFQFQDTAFSHVAAALVVGTPKPDLKIAFVNDTPFAYTVPYEEPFEAYADGSWITLATNGWTAEYAGAGTVTAESSLTSGEHGYAWPLPIRTNHTQTLSVQSDLRSEIHSVPNQMVYLDFMAWPAPMVDAPQVSTNQQFAFYVSTNGELVVWHQNRTGGVTNNETRVLTNAAPIDTNRWVRMTVCQDYSNGMFAVQVDNRGWIADAAGWTVPGPGGVPGGAWFYMIQTNRYMSRFRIAGAGSGYLDDLTVRTSFLNQTPRGAVFTFR